MKTAGRLAAGAIMGLVLGAACVEAAEEQDPIVSVEGEVALLNAYVWRGQVLNDEPVCQPYVSLGKWDLYASVWANYNLTDAVGDSDEFNEFDLTIGYEKAWEKIKVGVGITEYRFPNQVLTSESEDGTVTSVSYPGTRELFATVGMQGLAVGKISIEPSLSANYDFDEADGIYVSAAVAAAYSVSDWMDVNLSSSVGAANDRYNNYYFATDENALNDWNICASLPVKVAEAVSVTPCIQYTTLLTDKIKAGAESVPYFDTKQVVAGVKLAASF